MTEGDFITLSHTEAENQGYCKPHKIPGMSAESCDARKKAKPVPAACIKCDGLILGDKAKPEAWGQEGVGQGMKKSEEAKVAEEKRAERQCPKCQRMESECKGQWSKKTGLCNKCYQKWLKTKPDMSEFLGDVKKEVPIVPEKEDCDDVKIVVDEVVELRCPNCERLESECSGEFNQESGLCDPCYRRWLRRGKPNLGEFIEDEGLVLRPTVGSRSAMEEAEGEARRAAVNSKFARSAMTKQDTIVSLMEVHGGGLLFQGLRPGEDSVEHKNFMVGPEAAQLLADMVIAWRNGKQ